MTDGQTDGRTEESIWVGMGSLWLFQVNAKIAFNSWLQLSSPNLYNCSTVAFRTMLWETTLLLL